MFEILVLAVLAWIGYSLHHGVRVRSVKEGHRRFTMPYRVIKTIAKELHLRYKRNPQLEEKHYSAKLAKAREAVKYYEAKASSAAAAAAQVSKAPNKPKK